MNKLYEDLKQISGGSAYAERALGEIHFLQSMFLAEDGAVPQDVKESVIQLLAQVKAEGALTRALCRNWENSMMHYSSRCKTYRLICAGHAHIDMNWMWGTDETVGIVIDTFQTMLNLMDEYPEFCFSQSQASTYQMIETYCPSMLPQIKRRIQEGRWEVTASTWVEADQNMPNTESFLNHFYESKKYLSSLLDIAPASLDLDFEPDTFGHSIHMPALQKTGGVRYFYFCRGYDHLRAFRWRAPSGEEVLAYCEPNWYLSHIHPDIAAYLPQWCKENGLKTGLKLYGVGDHGGGVTRRDLERIRQLQDCPLLPTICCGRIHDFFQELELVRQQLPVVDHELNFIFPGCYTTQARIKQANRHGEDHLHDTQALTAMSMLAGCEDPNPGCFRKAWQKLLFNQFHDILPGSCIRKPREAASGFAQDASSYALGSANRAMRNLGQLVDTSLYGIRTDPTDTAEGSGVGLDTCKASGLEQFATGSDYRISVTSRGGGDLRCYTIYNPTQFDREEPVELILWDWRIGLHRTAIYDGQKQGVPFQITASNQVYWCHCFHRIVLNAKVPAFGYANYYIMDAETSPILPDINPNPRLMGRASEDYVLENSRIRAVLCCDCLKIRSLVDKVTGQELLREPAAFRLVQEATDPMSAWVVGNYEKITDLNSSCPVHVIDYTPGSIVQSLRYELHFGRSKLIVKVSLEGECSTLRLSLDVDYQEVANKEHVPQLQLLVPYAYSPEAIRCDVPGGEIDRRQEAFDLPALRYLCPVAASGSSLVFTSDCKYGYRPWNNSVIIDLLRASLWPDPYPEQGIHQIELGIAVTQDCSRQALVKIGTLFSHGLYPYSNSLHSGNLPQSGSLLQVHGAEVLSVRPGTIAGSVLLALDAWEDTPRMSAENAAFSPCDLWEQPTAGHQGTHRFYQLQTSL